jgi:hypothetical protein
MTEGVVVNDGDLITFTKTLLMKWRTKTHKDTDNFLVIVAEHEQTPK